MFGKKLQSRVLADMWNSKCMHPNFKNANIVTIFKTNDRHVINNYHYMSLLSVTGKLLALVFLNRIMKVTEETLPESWCGLRPKRGTNEMIFALHQVTEKSWDQRCVIYKGIWCDKSQSTVECIDQDRLSAKNHIYCEGSLH